MKIHIRHDGVAVDDEAQGNLQRRLDFALSGLSDRINQVLVKLSRHEGTSLGRVLHCDIEVKLRPRSVRVADTGTDVKNAVENATARLGRSVSRAIERERGWAHDAPAAVPAPRRK